MEKDEQLALELQEKFNCMFANLGSEIGQVLGCMIQQSIASHLAQVSNLEALLSGKVCNPQSDSTTTSNDPVV